MPMIKDVEPLVLDANFLEVCDRETFIIPILDKVMNLIWSMLDDDAYDANERLWILSTSQMNLA